MLKELVTVKKRKHAPVPRYEIWSTVGKNFDAAKDRERGECCYHPGKCCTVFDMQDYSAKFAARLVKWTTLCLLTGMKIAGTYGHEI